MDGDDNLRAGNYIRDNGRVFMRDFSIKLAAR